MTTPAITIHSALVAAQAEMRAAQKSGDNTFDKYSYAKLEDYMEVAKPILAKHGLALVMSTDEIVPLPDRTTKNGGSEHAVRVLASGTIIHETGGTICVKGVGEGQDRADKAIYKAITGARKYVIAGLLAIPTTDDPESDEAVGLSDKRGKAGKVDLTTGEARGKKTTLSDEQTAELGTMRRELIDYLGDGSDSYRAADADIKATWKRYAYSPAETIIEAIHGVHTKWMAVVEQRAQETKP